MIVETVSRFPPSFDGNPWTYGFALFSLTLITAISLAILVGYALDARTKRDVSRAIGNELPIVTPPAISPLSLHRMIVSGFLLTIVLGAFPDVLVLLAWGEAADDTIEALFTIDRIGDGILVMPFLCSASLVVWAGQAVDHKLALDSAAMTLRPSWIHLKERLKMVAIVFLIATGVTLAKSVA
ncbi:hypothetical protein [Sphingomonas sp. LY160]|uniref:hypothetical protein n=1 Tax=Sphingomonas sp. LY160 TaxID=3095342 RepID=UPI002ADED9B5|nr:hypothetical protein [Sphingomonas sp. LY160]MEA1071301.1 hypothetical protein [Sphingomonas sp. LY160]